MRPWIPGFAALAVAVATPVAAQTATVDPGMTRAEVVAVLGKPVGERTTGQYMYLFYRNNCEIRCGMQDLVILQNDLVVDAIFRSSRRVYSGASSSPNGVVPTAGASSGSLRTSEGANEPPTRTGGGTVSGGSRGGIVTGTSSPTATETPTTNRATVGGAGVVSSPVGTATSRPPAPRGIDTSKVLDGVPLNPRDTTTIQPSRTQGQLTPSSRDQQPIPYSGSKPNSRDSAVKARTGQKPDTVKPPRD